ncbi:glycolipid transfer protein domain-containing protein [Leptodontidium sp. 2 PMI_412]|nr:glycolipid transfer protein domain-containing protein [Leptodontidium sp. 2 PMI_412]
MSAPISAQLHNLTQSLNVLDASVSPDGKIPLLEFLNAVDSLLAVFETVGSDVLEGGRTDLQENVVKIRNAVQSFPGQSQYLQHLIEAERATGQHNATEGLLWITRGLEFYVTSIKRIAGNGSEKLADSIMNAYKDTLKTHHGFVAKMAIKVAVSKTCPTRDELFSRLGQDPSTVTSTLQSSARSFERMLHLLSPFLSRSGIKF